MTFTVEFRFPENMESPEPNFNRLLSELHEKIGKEQLENRLEAICMDWALNSGYYFEKQGNNFVFTHVGLKPVL